MEKYISVNKNTYNKVANEFKNRHKYLRINEPTARDYYDKIMKYMTKKDCLKYLELGPGDGHILKFFSSQNIETYAIEISKNMCKLCRDVSPNSIIFNKNVLNFEFNNNFDIIFAGSFIHLFNKSDLNILMNKIYDCLDENGVFFAYTTKHEIDEEGYFSKEKTNYKQENIRFRHKFTKESLIQLLEEHKFKILEHYEISEPENNRIWQFVVAHK